MKTILRTFVGCTAILFGTACMGAVKYVPENMKVELSLKVPGNNAVNYKLRISWRIAILIMSGVRIINCR